MTALKTVIVDDESLARRGLRLRLQKYPRIAVVAECQNGRQALAAVTEHQADLLFLDIQMPGMDGFQVVRNLQSDAMPMVVFVTAFDQYALDAFGVHAVDYVLKPVDDDRLERTVQRVLGRFDQQQVVTEKQRLIEFIAQMTGEQPARVEQLAREGSDIAAGAPLPRLAIKDGSTVHRVPIADIEWVEAAGDYMCVHAAGTTHVMRATMKELEAALESHPFARIHRSTLVNINRVKTVEPLENGKYQISLEGGHKLTMSRGYREQLTQLT